MPSTVTMTAWRRVNARFVVTMRNFFNNTPLN